MVGDEGGHASTSLPLLVFLAKIIQGTSEFALQYFKKYLFCAGTLVSLVEQEKIMNQDGWQSVFT